MVTNSSPNTLADHQALFEHPRCTDKRASLMMDLHAGQYDSLRTRLKRLYATHYNISEADWAFLNSIALVRRDIRMSHVITHGDPPGNCIFTHLLKGHGPIRDLYEANVDALLEAGLLRRPRICGEPRKRLINKPYYVLTPEATDCIEAGIVGPGIGDLGETVTHAVGARLYGEYMRHCATIEGNRGVGIRYYDDGILDDHEIDVVVYTSSTDSSHGRELFAVGEVKTVLSDTEEALDALRKLGAVRCDHKHVITPRRELFNQILNHAVHRGWYTMNKVPETLPLETAPETGIRATNDRLADSTYTDPTLGAPLTTPLTKGYTYTMLARALKEEEPTLFDQPVPMTARL